jgi:hypothetical protein
MHKLNRQLLIDSIDSACASHAGFTSSQIACEVATAIALENPQTWAVLRDELAVDNIAGMIQRRVQRAADNFDPRQATLDIPEYPGVPRFVMVQGKWSELRGLNQQQFRQYLREFRSRINSYECKRRSKAKVDRDNAALRSLEKVDAATSKYFAGDGGVMSMGEAIDLRIAYLKTSKAIRNRKGGKARQAIHQKSTT